MIDACLTDIMNLDYGSDNDSEFGGAAALVEAAASSPALKPAAGSFSAAAAESPLPSAAVLDSHPHETAAESGAAGGVSGKASAHLPQGWKLAQHGSGQTQCCSNSAATAPFWQRFCGSSGVLVCASLTLGPASDSRHWASS